MIIKICVLEEVHQHKYISFIPTNIYHLYLLYILVVRIWVVPPNFFSYSYTNACTNNAPIYKYVKKTLNKAWTKLFSSLKEKLVPEHRFISIIHCYTFVILIVTWEQKLLKCRYVLLIVQKCIIFYMRRLKEMY